MYAIIQVVDGMRSVVGHRLYDHDALEEATAAWLKNAICWYEEFAKMYASTPECSWGKWTEHPPMLMDIKTDRVLHPSRDFRADFIVLHKAHLASQRVLSEMADAHKVDMENLLMRKS